MAIHALENPVYVLMAELHLLEHHQRNGEHKGSVKSCCWRALRTV